jgi:hypothetical protein
MHCPCLIRRFQLPLLAALSVSLAVVFLTLGQDVNAPAVAAGGDTNTQERFSPPSSNSLSFQETKAPQPIIQSPTDATVSLKEWQTRAESGDASAQYALGGYYYSGEGLLRNYPEAVKWTRKAAEQGHAYAQYNLGCFYQNGQGVTRDYTEAAKWYRRAAEQGNGRAQIQTAIAYYIGQGVPQDYTEAVKWFRKVAEDGNAYAQYDLGIAYRDGQGVKQDYQEAVKWFRKSAEQGFLQGQYDLGWCYQTGHGVAQDYAEAVIWLRKPAEQGNIDAESFLGWCYETGNGVAQDYALAIKWFQKAADQGGDEKNSLVDCYYGVALSYLEQNNDLQLRSEGVKSCRKAAESGDARAECTLGMCYATGLGVAMDIAEASKWSLKAAEQYRPAAEQGDAEAQETLGDCYDNAHDFVEAVKWLRRAAAQGNMVAQHNLGCDYRTGQGTPKNDIEAYKWLTLAAAQGFSGSAELRDSLAESMSREEVVEAQSRAAAFVPRKEVPETSRNPNSPTPPRLPEFHAKASGTAFFISEDGYLLTASHVVEDAARIAIRTKAGTFTATLVKADKANDVALLKVAGRFQALPIASSRAVKLGESVFTIGYPNIELQGYAPKLTKGDLSSLTGMQDDPREFQISVPVQPGNSGGPLVDRNGNVVGMVEAQLADIDTLKTTGSLPQNVNYAMKSSAFNLLLECLPELSAKLKEPNASKDRKFEDVENEAESAVALVLVY